jgi:hypothetical protein
LGITKELGCRLPKVGSVEEFQGGEKKIIIFSLVRTCEKDDSRLLSRLSFVFNKKRFNVSATRAKALFIVVGDPFVFGEYGLWRSFISYCIKNMAYTGCDLPLYLKRVLKKVTPLDLEPLPLESESDQDQEGSESDRDSASDSDSE